MTKNFTQKEMLIRVMDKIDIIEEKVNGLAGNTSTIKFHSKLIGVIYTIIFTIAAWITAPFFGGK